MEKRHISREHFGKTFMDMLKYGLIEGPSLYVMQKTVGSLDSAANNVLPKAVPQEVRTPLIGVALATGLHLLPAHYITEKLAEYSLASALAQAITLAGNGGNGLPGVIDQQVNKVFGYISQLGLPAQPTAPATTQGYVPGGQRGYVPGGQRGYVQKVAATAGSPMRGSMRSTLRGFQSEVY